jgi:glycosyltransferase involved in cell wall biosynthesis
MSPEILKAINRFQPELTYGWLGDPIWGWTLTRLAAKLRIPYVIHFMDNHIGLDPENDWAARLSMTLFRRQVNAAVHHAAAVFAISDAMAASYGARWNRPILAFHGVMGTETWPQPVYQGDNPVFEIAFMGSIEQSQFYGLLDVAKAVEELNNNGVPAILVLYLTDYYRDHIGKGFSAFHHVTIRPHPDANGLQVALRRAGALILAYGFDRETLRYYQYSFPTKLVPYMLSGRPILAYGPPSIAPIAYVLRGGWGLVIKERSVERLAESIMELIKNPAECARLGTLAHEEACREHDQSKVAAEFAEALAAAAGCRLTAATG